MSELISALKATSGTLLGTFGLTGVLVVYFLLNPEKVEKWALLLYRFAHWIVSSLGLANSWVDRKRLGSQIEVSVNSAVQRLNADAPGIAPHLCRVEWADQNSATAYLADDVILIKLDPAQSPEKNVVFATLAFLSRGLLPRTRGYIDRPLLRATDLIVAQQILASEREVGGSQHFVESIIRPELDAGEDLRAAHAMLDQLDQAGYFARMYLNELSQLGDRLQPRPPSRGIETEIRRFATFLYTIATKQKTQEVPLQFTGLHLHLAVVLVAKRLTLEQIGIAAHLRRIERLVRDGCNAFYLTAWSDQNVMALRDLLRAVEQDGLLTVLDTSEYDLYDFDGSSRPAIVAVCTSNAEYLRRVQDLTRPLEATLKDCIPEIATGIWKVVGIEREPGLLAKVLVKLPEGAPPSQIISEVLRREQGALDKLRSAAAGDPVFIVPWSADPESLIIAALRVDRNDVVRISLNEDEGVADVTVRESVTPRAIGRQGSNALVAGRLTGWLIRISDSPADNAEYARQLLVYLREHVPMLGNADVEVVAAVRVPNVGSKIGVRSADGASFKRFNREVRESLVTSRFSGEFVRIFEWSEDFKELVIRALHPLRAEELSAWTESAESQTVAIGVTSKAAAARAIGGGGVNVRLVEQMTGRQITVEHVTPPVRNLAERSDRDEAIARVRAAFARHIPPVASGQIEVVSFATADGVGAKVAVRVTRGDSSEAARACGLRSEAIREELKLSFLNVIPWSDDIEAYLRAAVYPLQSQRIRAIEIQREQSRARVIVDGPESMALGIGAHARNLRLVEELTGYSVQFGMTPTAENEISP